MTRARGREMAKWRDGDLRNSELSMTKEENSGQRKGNGELWKWRNQWVKKARQGV